MMYCRPNVISQGFTEFNPLQKKEQIFEIEKFFLDNLLHKNYVNELVRIKKNEGTPYNCREHIAMSATAKERVEAAYNTIVNLEKLGILRINEWR